MSSVILCRGKKISDRGYREGLHHQKEVIPMEKESKKPEFYYCMFLLLDSKIGDQKTNEWLTALIDDHISNLEKKTKDYFPTSEPSSVWIQQSFIVETNDNEQFNLHGQHLELQSSQAAKTKFSSSSLIEFWCSMFQEYPELAKRALEALIPFPMTYLCEAAMSALVNIKTTYCNRLRVANDMKIALSNINPHIDELVSKRQEQRSHWLIICAVFCRVNCDIPLTT